MIFRALRADCARLRGHRILDLSKSRHSISLLEILKFVKIMALTFLHCGSTCDLTDVPASINDIEKPRPAQLTLSTTFYELSVSRNVSKGKLCQFGSSGTEGLRTICIDTSLIWLLNWWSIRPWKLGCLYIFFLKPTLNSQINRMLT